MINHQFSDETGKGTNLMTGEKNVELNKIARHYKEQGKGWVAFGDENIGEGSSREHAAMEPRHMGCLAFISKSYARIFEANLKKQAVLPLTLVNKEDYDKIQEKDKVSLLSLDKLSPGENITMKVTHEDGKTEEIALAHTLNEKEMNWFKAGSALNFVGGGGK